MAGASVGRLVGSLPGGQPGVRAGGCRVFRPVSAGALAASGGPVRGRRARINVGEYLDFSEKEVIFVLQGGSDPALINLTNLTGEVCCRKTADLFFRAARRGCCRAGWRPGGCSGVGLLPRGERVHGGSGGARLRAPERSEKGDRARNRDCRPLAALWRRFHTLNGLSRGISDLFCYFCVNWEKSELKCRSCMTGEMS